MNEAGASFTGIACGAGDMNWYGIVAFDFELKTVPAAVQLLEAAKLKSGSPEPNRQKVGSVTWDQIAVIANDKMADLNAFTVGAASMMIAGTARSMGLTVKGTPPEGATNKVL